MALRGRRTSRIPRSDQASSPHEADAWSAMGWPHPTGPRHGLGDDEGEDVVVEGLGASVTRGRAVEASPARSSVDRSIAPTLRTRAGRRTSWSRAPGRPSSSACQAKWRLWRASSSSAPAGATARHPAAERREGELHLERAGALVRPAHSTMPTCVCVRLTGDSCDGSTLSRAPGQRPRVPRPAARTRIRTMPSEDGGATGEPAGAEPFAVDVARDPGEDRLGEQDQRRTRRPGSAADPRAAAAARAPSMRGR